MLVTLKDEGRTDTREDDDRAMANLNQFFQQCELTFIVSLVIEAILEMVDEYIMVECLTAEKIAQSRTPTLLRIIILCPLLIILFEIDAIWPVEELLLLLFIADEKDVIARSSLQSTIEIGQDGLDQVNYEDAPANKPYYPKHEKDNRNSHDREENRIAL